MNCHRVSIKDVLTGVTQEPPNLGGFLALTDSVVSLILNSQSQTIKMKKVTQTLMLI